MKTLMVLLAVLIALMIQVDASYYDEEDNLGPNMDMFLKRRPISKISHKCSTDKTKYPYGCCLDNETPVPPPDGNLNRDQRCGRVMCFDAGPDYCQRNKNNCHDSNVKRWCAFTCQKCKSPASPKERCEKNKDTNDNGCCWDGTPATGGNNEGCTECKNKVPEKRCKKWKRNNGDTCVSGKFGITDYLAKNCAEFCNQC